MKDDEVFLSLAHSVSMDEEKECEEPIVVEELERGYRIKVIHPDYYLCVDYDESGAAGDYYFLERDDLEEEN